MARTVDPHKVERNAKICEEFRRNPSQSDKTLGQMFGVDAVTIGRILRDAGLISRATRRPRTPTEEQRPASNLLAALGTILDRACNELILDKENARVDLETGFNSNLLARMRCGLHNFTVLEIEKLCIFLKTTPDKLMLEATTIVNRTTRSPGKLSSTGTSGA
jgi:hypothetical protein